jgi:hypothetical protein
MTNGRMVLGKRTKYYGWDYKRNRELRMTGKEWHQYAKLETFSHQRGSDAVTGNSCEIWLDGTDLNHKKHK